MQILKKLLAGIGIAMIGLVLSFCAVDYHRTHSGPFRFFADLPGEGSPYQRGKKAIDGFIGGHPTEEDMKDYLRTAGFECESREPSRSRRFSNWPSMERHYGSKLTRHTVCSYVFGPPGIHSSRMWYVEAFVGPDKGYIHHITCGYCP